MSIPPITIEVFPAGPCSAWEALKPLVYAGRLNTFFATVQADATRSLEERCDGFAHALMTDLMHAGCAWGWVLVQGTLRTRRREPFTHTWVEYDDGWVVDAQGSKCFICERRRFRTAFAATDVKEHRPTEIAHGRPRHTEA